uniref:Myb dna-binding domain superfamily protein n=1 Tax=Tetraselmis sp. GSL018 TaxID=582737 RepID=A0A061QVW3_9CHLO|mmetsp:Transcript_865/g.2078  ORF Transcript_865/g.2078 Transcript_865/m.2078 type:complete len:265 (+) Transcript_865:328-1122(+)|eukprot:CAMPEP_0177610170 /NCGR_PEP_ID=MMETSP0419_2-20121207/19607_1 /TAXON_ID=582737 /ORGANISM="Tetraselmis sp., Strain GSL018" /LENGTH=264 /DNA_ID=CAMNT_0019105399 /DNA_START=290 /DNA_END=1084 /DNA_ORIENTATION=+
MYQSVTEKDESSVRKGVPWSEDEHRRFLAGLDALGKGDWRGISMRFVRTRTPTQVASHAQKYFLRTTQTGSKRKRSSLFDIRLAGDNEEAISRPEDTSLVPKKQRNCVIDGNTSATCSSNSARETRLQGDSSELQASPSKNDGSEPLIQSGAVPDEEVECYPYSQYQHAWQRWLRYRLSESDVFRGYYHPAASWRLPGFPMPSSPTQGCPQYLPGFYSAPGYMSDPTRGNEGDFVPMIRFPQFGVIPFTRNPYTSHHRMACRFP